MDDGGSKRSRGRGRSARGRTRGRGRGRGRGKKAVKIIESDEELDQQNDSIEEQQVAPLESAPNENSTTEIDLEADISQLEAPTFTTINRGPPEPMLRLDWSHKVNLIGEKVLNPMIHCCDKCLKPILIYGRMIPCKHVFCHACGKQEQKQCPRCLDKVSRVEQTGLGTVFMCTHGGSRYGSNGCRRTYLSQRDLQAHINHRHVAQTPASIDPVEPAPPPPPPPAHAIAGGRGGAKGGSDPRASIAVSTSVRQRSNAPPLSGGAGVRTNLITVPIQDSAPCEPPPGSQQQLPPPPPPQQQYYSQYQQHQHASGGGGGAYGHGQTPLPPMHIPPPQQGQYYQSHAGYGASHGHGGHGGQSYQGYGGQAPPPPPPSAQYAQAQPVGAPSNRAAQQQYDYSAAPPQQWTTNHFYR